MTSEETIRDLADTLQEAHSEALRALRELRAQHDVKGVEIKAVKPAKLDRSLWEGCDYCNDPSPNRDCVLPDGTEQFLCSRNGAFEDCCINERSIRFCPMCGKPLKEKAWAELERRIERCLT